MLKIKLNKFSSLIKSSLFLITTSSIVLFTSCSTIKTEEKQPNFVYKFIRSFKDNEYVSDYSYEQENLIWSNNEKIYEDNDFLIKVENNFNNIVFVDLFNKNIEKYYAVKFEFDHNLKMEEKRKLNQVISKSILENWKKHTTREYYLDSYQLHIPVSHSNKSIKIKKDADVEFWTKNRNYDSRTGIAEFILSIDKEKVKKALLASDYLDHSKHICINDVYLNNLNYLPIVSVINNPIEDAIYKQNKVYTFNNDQTNVAEMENELQEKEFKLPLVENSTWGQEFLTMLKVARGINTSVGSILKHINDHKLPYINQDGYDEIKKINDKKAYKSRVSQQKENFKNLEPRETEEEIINKINEMGIKTKINHNLTDEAFNLFIQSSIKFGARGFSALGIFSKAKLYGVLGLISANIKWTEYLEFDYTNQVEY